MAAIQNARATLLAEFDQPRPAEVLALSRAYLYAGFGAEAKSTLTSFIIESSDQDIIRDIANIMDSEQVGQSSRLLNQHRCPGPAALWAILATQANIPSEFARSDVLSIFSALPIHLRSHLGPRLAEKFLAVGDIDASHAVRNSILRGGTPQGSELETTRRSI